jgi:REP element-mobilizing transposase RayT
MLTWTTYGTWLQGNKKGYVKDGIVILGTNATLAAANKKQLRKEPVILTLKQRKIIKSAFRVKAEQIKQKILALSVCSDHVHIVLDYTTMDIGQTVRNYKVAGLKALRGVGFEGPLWTKGFDKRFCFDERTIRKRIEYVNNH